MVPRVFASPSGLALFMLFLISVAYRVMAAPLILSDPEPSPDPRVLDTVSIDIEPINYSLIENPIYAAELISTVCPFISLEEAQEMTEHNFARWGTSAVIPLPHNIRHDILPPSLQIGAIISGTSLKNQGREKAICLNHLAFAISRRVPYYFFFTPEQFPIMNNIYPYAMKIAALRAMFKLVERGKWVIWIDDDVISSDFYMFPYYLTEHHQDYTLHKSTQPVRSLLDRVISTTENSIQDEIKSTNYTDFCASIIFSQDVGNTLMNTGIFMAKSELSQPDDHRDHAIQLLNLFWNYILDDQPPRQVRFFCHITTRYYQHLQECLNACEIETPSIFEFCGPDKSTFNEHKQYMHKIHYGYNYDQSVINDFLTRYPQTRDHVAIVDQDGDFGLKHKDEHGNVHTVKETFNSFFRTTALKGEIKSWYPFLDKWTHISGLPKLQKNALAYLWLSAIKHYPVRTSEFGVTASHYEILPRPYDEAEWEMASPTTATPDSTDTTSQSCPSCPKCLPTMEEKSPSASNNNYYFFTGYAMGILFAGEVYFVYRVICRASRIKCL